MIAVGAVGVLVLDIGNDLQEPPPAAFSFSYTQNGTAGDELLITHVAGDELPKETIVVQVRGLDVTCAKDIEDWCQTHPEVTENSNWDADWDELELEDQSAGDTVTATKVKDHYLDYAGWSNYADRIDLHLDRATVRIVWEGGSGSVIVDEWAGPDA